jgi:hypothetical protein
VSSATRTLRHFGDKPFGDYRAYPKMPILLWRPWVLGSIAPASCRPDMRWRERRCWAHDQYDATSRWARRPLRATSSSSAVGQIPSPTWAILSESPAARTSRSRHSVLKETGLAHA